MNFKKFLLLFFTITLLQSTAQCAEATYTDFVATLQYYQALKDDLNDMDAVIAIRSKDSTSLSYLLHTGLNPNKTIDARLFVAHLDPYKKSTLQGKRSLLQMAICSRDPEEFARLLTTNRRLLATNRRENPDRSPTIIRDGFITPIKLLLDAGANPNDRADSKLYPLNLAWHLTEVASTPEIENSKILIATYLLRKGANPKVFHMPKKIKMSKNESYDPSAQTHRLSEFSFDVDQDYDATRRFFIPPNFPADTCDQVIAKYLIRHGANADHSFYGDAIKKELATENKAHCAFQELAARVHPFVPDDVPARIFSMLHGSLDESCFTEFYKREH